MGNKEYLNVNELATLFGLKVQTLHYYDKIGILKPSYRDQTMAIENIVLTRHTSWHLSAICVNLDILLKQSGIFRTPKILTKHCSVLKNVCSYPRTMGRNDADRSRNFTKIQFIEDSKDEIDYEGFRIVEYPERKYISIGTETEIYAGESFYFYPTLVFYEGTKKEFGALLTDEIPEENVDIHKIPAGTYVVGYHKGAYEQISG
mgnify:CR=1 FL=1